jgi:hypothetical protein
MGEDARVDPGWPDPTVHVPYRLRVETASGDTEVLVASFVALSSRAVLAFDPDGRCIARLDPREVSSIEALVRELPGDYDELRARHRNAYEPWPDHVGQLWNLKVFPGMLAELVRDTGRPAAHVLTKAAAMGIDVRTVYVPPPGSEPMPLRPRQAKAMAEHARRYAQQDHLVFLRSPGIEPDELLVRHRIRSYATEIYRMARWGFAARLRGHEVDALSTDPDVERIEPDEHRLAPVFNLDNPNRIPGSYLADVRRGADPILVTNRNGIAPDTIAGLMTGLFAVHGLGDAELDRLRRDPDVTYLECNAVFVNNA